MCRIDPFDALRCLGWHKFREVHCNGLAVAPHQDTLQALVFQRIDLLMRHIWWHKDEIARPSLGCELERLSPPHARFALEYIDDLVRQSTAYRTLAMWTNRFKVAVVMGASLCIGMDSDSPRPKLLSADPSLVDGRCTRHAYTTMNWV